MLRAILNKSWRQHPTRHQLYGHLPPITKTIQVRRTRPTHGRAKAGPPARTYIQLLCEDTGCCPEDLPRVMNDREEWRERVRDIRATSATWWWYIYIYIYVCVCVCVCVCVRVCVKNENKLDSMKMYGNEKNKVFSGWFVCRNICQFYINFVYTKVIS